MIFAERIGTCGSVWGPVPNLMSLFEELDQLVGGSRLDEILKSIGAVLFLAAQRADTTVTLNALRMTRKAGGAEARFRLGNGDWIIEPLQCGGIGGSLLRHAPDDNAARHTARPVIHTMMLETD